MNVLYQPLPDEWNGYRVNMDFRIGIQLYQVSVDDELTKYERAAITAELLFAEETDDGLVMRDHPSTSEEIEELIKWYLSGWNLDGKADDNSREQLVDFEIDQWRIYADFRNFYHIDLNEIEELHFWAFMGMLWNMPAEQSSFLQVVGIRKRKPGKRATAEEKEQLARVKRIYALKQPEREKEYTDEQKSKIDAFDAARKAQKEQQAWHTMAKSE